MADPSGTGDVSLNAPNGDNGSAPNEQVTLRRVELSAAPIGRLINVISFISGLIAVIVIGGVIVLSFVGKPIPDQLSNWGGIILGFYFGQFVSLVKDYMGAMGGGGRN